jgi:hypothetical protein
VKEVFETSTDELTTGTVSHADKLKGWFVTLAADRSARRRRRNDDPRSMNQISFLRERVLLGIV